MTPRSGIAISSLFAVAEDQRRVSRLFLRVLALIYFSAFASLALQIEGLAGSHGILPLAGHLDTLHQQLGAAAYWRVPMLFWLWSSDTALLGAALAGCGFSLLLLLDRLPRLSLAILFLLYLSLFHAGQIFMNFQWDYLLLEAGFLAIFVPGGASKLVIWLFHWLLFRLRFESGVSKLISGDPSWADLSALQFYFETQPLPHWGAWYAHQLPDALLIAGAVLILAAELAIPFLVFLPRRFRLAAAWITLLTQVLILLSSNHNFFNLLTMALCLLLLDDRALGATSAPTRPEGLRQHGVFYTTATALVAAVVVPVSAALGLEMVGVALAEPVAVAAPYVRAFGLAHRYHVFPTISRQRIEIELQGSRDGSNWQPYPFRYKPQALDRRPAFIVPHQPRLDWMAWFVPLSLPMNQQWLDGLVGRLFENEPAVTDLLNDNPFADGAPRYIRAQLFLYRFTTAEQKAKTGDWWQREPLGPLLWVPWINPSAR